MAMVFDLMDTDRDMRIDAREHAAGLAVAWRLADRDGDASAVADGVPRGLHGRHRPAPRRWAAPRDADARNDRRSPLAPPRCGRYRSAEFEGETHDRDPPVRLRHAADPRRCPPRSGHRRAADADLPDHGLCLPRRRTCRRAVQPAGSRLHLFAPDQPHRGRSAGTHRHAGGRRRRGLLLLGARGADHGAVPADAAGLQHRRLHRGSTAARSRSSARRSNASAGRAPSSISTTWTRSRRPSTTTPAPSSARPSPTPAAGSWTCAPWPTSPTRRASR